MQVEHSKKIQRQYKYILDNMFNIDNLVETLFSEDVLNMDTMTRINEEKAGRPRVKKLLHILMTECGDCYQTFLKALRENSFSPIADKLEKDIPASRRSVVPKTKCQIYAKQFLIYTAEKKYVKTAALKKGISILITHFILGIIGTVGDGKTVLCRMIANLFLDDNPDFIPLEIREPNDMETIQPTDQNKYLLIIDDMFGTWRSTIQQKRREWEKHFERLYLAKEAHEWAIIYVVRIDVYQTCKHLSIQFEIFNKLYLISLHEKKFQLTKEEKTSILRYHLGNNTCDNELDEMLKYSADCFGFPLVAKLCSESSGGQTSGILKSLDEFLHSKFDVYWEEGINIYIALFIVFGLQRVAECDLLERTGPEIRNILDDVCKVFRNEVTPRQVIDSCSELDGSFVRHEDDRDKRMFLPDPVMRSYLFHVGRRYRKLTIEYCPFQLLMDGISTVRDDQRVFIKPELYVDLCSRLSHELSKNNLSVLYHQAFVEDSFLQTFLNDTHAHLLFNPDIKMKLGEWEDEGHFIHYVCLFGYLEELKSVMSYSANITPELSDIKTKSGLDLLCVSIRSKKEWKDKLEYLRDPNSGVIKHQTKADRDQLIRTAVQLDNIDTLLHIKSFTHIDISSVDRENRTLLLSACDSHYDIPEIVKYLIIDLGADINAKDNAGCNALHLATKRGKAKTIDFLAGWRKTINKTDIEGRIPLHYAASCNAGRIDIDSEGIVKTLVRVGSDINAKDNRGRTALTEARSSCHGGSIISLLSRGVGKYLFIMLLELDCIDLLLLSTVNPKVLKLCWWPLSVSPGFLKS
ncbi:hypothetical protein SNE40_011136 [Patella caerulea]|uniref:CARD domain-containing protein n=1 Tax=Patella caerulea TaxID=87958 RepID=A0AAN8K3G6_PATCE